MTQKKDITKMTVAEIQEFIDSKLAEVGLAENAPNDAPRRRVENDESGVSVDDRCGFGGEALGE